MKAVIVIIMDRGVAIRTSLRFEKRLNFSINPRKLSIFYRSFSNRSEALVVIAFCGK